MTFRRLVQISCLYLLLTGSLLSAAAQRAEAAAANPWTQSFYFENDLFNGTDSNYTNGVKYSLISPDLSVHAQNASLPRQVLETIHKLPFIAESGPSFSHKAEFSLGQNIYTPKNIEQTELIADDRPYAGWTYLGLAYHRRARIAEGREFLDSVEIQLGMVGPWSFAEEVQTLVHELRSLETAKGWDNQLQNEPGLVIAFERKRLFYPGKSGPLAPDLILHAGGALGNVSTYLNAGFEVRFGLNMPRNFGVSVIRPAGSTRFSPGRKPSAYLFAAINGKYVLHDIFMDGNTFTDSHSVDKKPLVADLAVGLSISYGNWMLTYANVTRTPEFEGQEEGHTFGSLTFSFFYPFW
ncbi:MAG TPA: lipid A deacylase LpxR family protein [Desulfuromonadales bacterium]|nr:lipid A deacylase LpxR family protein [Desulfuromonadales bacterium]